MSATVNSLYSDPSAPCILGLYCSNMAIYFKANKITDSESCVAVSTYMKNINIPIQELSHFLFQFTCLQNFLNAALVRFAMVAVSFECPS